MADFEDFVPPGSIFNPPAANPIFTPYMDLPYPEVEQRPPEDTRIQWERQPMIWELYDSTLVEMYINPQNVSLQANKKITYNRTKGGFMVQYWGDDLLTMTLNGTTGSSGIEGIELLYDVYQSELLSPSRLDELHGITAGRQMPGSERNPGYDDDELKKKVRRSDLVSRATQVCLWYGQKRYFGFFTAFNIQEAAANPGEYMYNMTYMIWKTIGRDKNYMPWHRSPELRANGETGVPESPWNVTNYPIQSPTLKEVTSTADSNNASQASQSSTTIDQNAPGGVAIPVGRTPPVNIVSPEPS